MGIRVKNLATNESVTFPMMPDKITTQAAQSFLSYRILQLGEVKLPSGDELLKFSWNGLLPGKNRRGGVYVESTSSPAKMQGHFSTWRSKGHRLQLTITGTPINCPVYLESYTCEEQGGCGDVAYSVTFVQARAIAVSAKAAPTAKKTATAKASVSVSKKTYTVKAGDSPWGIMQSQMGNGAQYQKLIDANRAEMEKWSKKYNWAGPGLCIYPGMVLTLPG